MKDGALTKPVSGIATAIATATNSRCATRVTAMKIGLATDAGRFPVDFVASKHLDAAVFLHNILAI